MDRLRARLTIGHKFSCELPYLSSCGVDAGVDVDVGVDGNGDGDVEGGGDRKQLRVPFADKKGKLSFQRLDVYRCAIEFVTVALEMAAKLPRGHSELKEQLRRAALSVPLNVAEGAGRISPPDAARHYAIARGSAMECAAILDVAVALGATSEEQHRRAVELLPRLVAMLTKMCR